MRLFIHVDLCTEQYYKPHVSLDRKQYVFCSVCHQCRGCFVVCRKVLISVVNTVSLENLITFVDSKPKHFHLSRDWILSSLALMYYFIYLNFSPSNSSSCKADFTPQMYQIWAYCVWVQIHPTFISQTTTFCLSLPFNSTLHPYCPLSRKGPGSERVL